MELPEEFELLALFGVDPELRLPGAPWDVNGLTFNVERENYSLRCHLETDVGEVTVVASHHGETIGSVSLKWVGSLEIDFENGKPGVLAARRISGNPDLVVRVSIGERFAVVVTAEPRC